MSAMSAKDTVRRNKTSIQRVLSGDHKLILNKVYEHDLITGREYKNLKSIHKENVEGHVVELVDTLLDKGEERCQQFLNLLETDAEIKETFPDIKTLRLNEGPLPTKPIQETYLTDNRDDGCPSKKPKKEEFYQVNSTPTGLCLIFNNMKFEDGSIRHGTDKDAECLAEVFSWLGFRVLMCKDQTTDQMNRTLNCFSDLSHISDLQQFNVKEWSSGGFVHLQQPPKHGDVFICCILSHGNKGVVCGTDRESLSIKYITRIFRGTEDSPLTAKPKVFLIQACQGAKFHRGVMLKELETDNCHSVSVPEEADVLVAVATVEDYVSFRNPDNGSWFIQSLCQQLKEGCVRGDDIQSILQSVNNEVSLKEGYQDHPGGAKQIPEVHYTLRKKLVLSPCHN